MSTRSKLHDPKGGNGLARDELRALHRMLLLIRRTEERLGRMFADGEVPGFIHLSIGQEAVSAGVMSALTKEDTIASTHRGHGHALAKGLPLDGFFSELLAKEEGLCRGRGGSMHVADLSVGMLGANGIVAAGLPIALGSAFAHQRLKRDAISVAFFGDGALAEGVFHETLNLAKLWSLPLLFVCENNGWGEFLPTSKQLAFQLSDLARTFAIPYEKVDGNDAAAVCMTARDVVSRIRQGGGPAIIECLTTRVRGHFEGDNQRYRDAEEMSAIANRDPLKIIAAQLLDLGETQAELAALSREVDKEIEAAVEAARRGRDPDFAAARADVYTPVELRP